MARPRAGFKVIDMGAVRRPAPDRRLKLFRKLKQAARTYLGEARTPFEVREHTLDDRAPLYAEDAHNAQITFSSPDRISRGVTLTLRSTLVGGKGRQYQVEVAASGRSHAPLHDWAIGLGRAIHGKLNVHTEVYVTKPGSR